jgi:hypothetical protein
MSSSALAEKSQESPQPVTCDRCQRTLSDIERVSAGGKTFCPSCFEALQAELHSAVDQMSRDVNYPMATAGALLGGAVGALVWWVVTVTTNIAFGLIAVVIGFLSGHGAVFLAGGKRSRGLQVVATLAAVASFLAANYLVNRSIVNKALAGEADFTPIGIIPASLGQLILVSIATFSIMDVVFLGIVVWQAWVIPQLPRIPKAAAK